MLQAEETVVMDVKPFPVGQGFAGGEEWWDYVLSGDEKDRLDSLMAAALLDEDIRERLLNGVDASVLIAFGLSEATISLIRPVEAATLPEFAQSVVSTLKLDKKPHSASLPEKGHGVNKLIMVVDDDPTTLQLLGLRFRQQGRAVLTVSSGDGALSLIRAVLPDLLIVDLYMPGLSGIDLCLRIRALQQTEHTPIIVYSSTRDDHLVERVQALPDARFVSKSAPLETLLSAASEMVTARAET